MFRWTLKNRKLLQTCLQKGDMLKSIVRDWNDSGVEDIKNITEAVLRSEVARGLYPEDLKARRYIQYDPYLVYERLIGKDAMDYCVERRNKK